jgi:small subunit ribosomal protein S8
MSYRLANTIANIKLGLKTKRISVRCYPTNFLKRILRKLTNEGILRGFSVDLENINLIRVHLKYDEYFAPVIKDIKIVSTSGKRVYFKYKEILEVHARGEIYLISTTKGIFTIDEIVYNNLQIGGEVILRVYYF